MPIRTGTYPTVFVRDVGQVVDGTDIVTSYALVDGRRTVYMPVTKRADASTLTVVDLVKQNLPRFQACCGREHQGQLRVRPIAVRDRARSTGSRSRARSARCSPASWCSLFLRDWRSALIVVVNIPLALLGAVLALWLTGETVNIMTLGGLALAIGVLVDMSTVVIENIHTHLASGKRVARAVADSGREVAVAAADRDALRARRVRAVVLHGRRGACDVPAALARGRFRDGRVVSALEHARADPVCVALARSRACGSSRRRRARARSRASNAATRAGLRARVRARWVAVAAYVVVSALVIGLVGRGLGTDIFPKVDTGQLQVRLRAPTGTRVDDTEQVALRALDIIKGEVGRGQRRDHARVPRSARAELPDQPHLSLERRLGGGRTPSAAQAAIRRRDRAVEGALAQSLRRADARRELLVRAERHREPGHELGLVDADRGRRERAESRGKSRVRDARPRAAREDPGAARRAVRPGARLPDARRQGGP